MENLQNWQRDICHLWDLNLWPCLPYLPTRFYLIECMFLHCENCGALSAAAKMDFQTVLRSEQLFCIHEWGYHFCFCSTWADILHHFGHDWHGSVDFSSFWVWKEIEAFCSASGFWSHKVGHISVNIEDHIACSANFSWVRMSHRVVWEVDQCFGCCLSAVLILLANLLSACIAVSSMLLARCRNFSVIFCSCCFCEGVNCSTPSAFVIWTLALHTGGQ